MSRASHRTLVDERIFAETVGDRIFPRSSFSLAFCRDASGLPFGYCERSSRASRQTRKCMCLVLGCLDSSAWNGQCRIVLQHTSFVASPGLSQRRTIASIGFAEAASVAVLPSHRGCADRCGRTTSRSCLDRFTLTCQEFKSLRTLLALGG